MTKTPTAPMSRTIDLGRVLTYRGAAAFLALSSMLCGLTLGGLVPWHAIHARLADVAECALTPAEPQVWSAPTGEPVFVGTAASDALFSIVNDRNGTPHFIVSIRTDGTVDLHGHTPDVAARAFWTEVERLARPRPAPTIDISGAVDSQLCTGSCMIPRGPYGITLTPSTDYLPLPTTLGNVRFDGATTDYVDINGSVFFDAP